MYAFSYLWQYFAELFLQWEIFQIKVVGKVKTHTLCPITSFRKSCRLWSNVEKCGGAREAIDNIIRRMRFVCWITKSTYTHSEYALLLALPRQEWFRERASVLGVCVHCLCCWRVNSEIKTPVDIGWYISHRRSSHCLSCFCLFMATQYSKTRTHVVQYICRSSNLLPLW